MLPKPIVSRSPHFVRHNPILGFNSVRHTVPYEGSTNVDDLLALYVGNKSYGKINNFLRSDNLDSGIGQILRESRIPDWDWERNLPVLSEKAFVKQQALKELNQDADKGDYVNLANDFLEEFGDAIGLAEKFKLDGAIQKYWDKEKLLNDYAVNHAPHLIDTSNWKWGANIEIANHILSSPSTSKSEVSRDLLNRHISKIKKDRKADAQQTIASVDLIKQAVTKRPRYEVNEEAILQKAKDWWLESPYNKDTELVNRIWLKNTTTNDDLDILDKYTQSTGYSISAPPPLQRGLHFKSPEAYQSFMAQHQPKQIVQYPAFTSTTSDRDILEGFSQNRFNEIPVVMEFKPNPFTNTYNARDIGNHQEMEYLYPPDSRFEVVAVEPLDRGSKIIVQETNQMSAAKQRAQEILSKLKSSLA